MPLLARHLLSLLGALAGAALGVLLVRLALRYGLYAPVLPGALLGYGCSIFAPNRSKARGIACAVAALILGVGLEWWLHPFIADEGLSFFLTHLHHVSPLKLLLIALGSFFGYYFGRESARPASPHPYDRRPAGFDNPVNRLGPVFAFEAIGLARRPWLYLARAAFVATLLIGLALTWASAPAANSPRNARRLAQVGRAFTANTLATGLALTLIVAPAATAGALASDRARGTLQQLFVTDLSNAEIVLGRLAARLLPSLGLVAATLPVALLATLLGGVDPAQLAGAFAILASCALLGSSLALTLSLLGGKLQDVLSLTYALLVAAFVLPPLLGLVTTLPPWLNVTQPFSLALGPFLDSGPAQPIEFAAFILATLFASALLVLLSVARLRPDPRPAPAASASSPPGPYRRDHDPLLDSNPVLWRELRRRRPSPSTRITTLGYLVSSLAFATWASVDSYRKGFATTGADIVVIALGLQVALGLLLLAVSASTSLAEERAHGSLDILLTTPLSTRSILLAKWLGAFRPVPLLALLACLPALAHAWAGDHLLALPLIFGLVLAYGAAITSLGLDLATRFARLPLAVGLTTAAYLLVTVGWMAMIIAVADDETGAALAIASPFYGPIYPLIDLGPLDLTRASIVLAWATLYALAAALLLEVTLATFDRRLGRIPDRPRPAPPKPKPPTAPDGPEPRPS